MKTKKQKNALIGLIILVIATALIVGIYIAVQSKNQAITDFDSCVAAGNPVQDSYPERCSAHGKTYTRPITGETPVTYEGTLVCLPHKDSNGPHSLECASGLLTAEGLYYHISSSDSSLTLATGSSRKVRIDGLLKPTDDSKYKSEGVITVSRFEFL